MANVHRIGDYNNNNNNRSSGRGGAFGGGYQAPPDSNIPFFSSINRGQSDPRKESPWDMFKYACCPQINLKMFIPYATIVEIGFFIFTLAVGGVQPGGDFLQPNGSTLEEYGAKDVCDMYEGKQVWRFITPIFLHNGFLHILFNMISQIIFGVMVEVMIGTGNTIIVYLASAIGGNLFGALLSTADSVGASTAIVGLLGAYIGWLIVNWKALDYPGSPRGMMLCFVVMIIVFNLMFGFGMSASSTGTNSQIDNWGHFGGLITGIFSSMAVITAIQRRNTKYEKKVKLFGWLLWIGYFILGFALFYTVVGPDLACKGWKE